MGVGGGGAIENKKFWSLSPVGKMNKSTFVTKQGVEKEDILYPEENLVLFTDSQHIGRDNTLRI